MSNPHPNTLDTSKTDGPKRVCQLSACPNPVDRRGFCRRHYMRLWRGVPLLTLKERLPEDGKCPRCRDPLRRGYFSHTHQICFKCKEADRRADKRLFRAEEAVIQEKLPKIVKRPKPKRYCPHWLKEELEWLYDNALKWPIEELTVQLNKTFDRQRTPDAVRGKLQRYEYSPYSKALNATKLAYYLGICDASLKRDLHSGNLKAISMHSTKKKNSWVILPEDIEDWIRRNLHRVWPEIMPKSRYRSLAEVLHRTDPFLTISQTAAMVGISTAEVRRLRYEGVLQGVWATDAQHRQLTRWLFRRSTIRAYIRDSCGELRHTGS